MSQNNDPLIYHEEDEIAFIEINRPEKKNALNYECWQLFDKYCDELIVDNQIRALVITGRPDDIFSAGVDVTPTDPFIADMFQAIQHRDKAKLVKEICDTTLTMPEDEALEFERKRAAETLLSEQCIEGISAFLEKRAPKWTS